MHVRMIPLAVFIMLTVSFVGGKPVGVESLSDSVVARYMEEKKIPGMSVAVVRDGELILAKGYGLESIEFNRRASAMTVYPISSVSRIIAGTLAMRLAKAGKLEIDSPIADILDGVPNDKSHITVRHLLQHTHGLADFYGSTDYREETGKSHKESSTDDSIRWSLTRPVQFHAGAQWKYGVVGYVILGKIFELAGGRQYEDLVDEYIFEPLNITAGYGDSKTVIPGRNPVLYELVENSIDGHIIEFSRQVWPAAGLNISVVELAKLFSALSDDEFLNKEDKKALWKNEQLQDGNLTSYGLGWNSYITSQDRWVVGHEGGGASWVVYYPEEDLAVIALSNMSMARADLLPYEIARAIFEISPTDSASRLHRAIR